jgi:fucose 4-O-acetylase-like acetyltransferase
MTRRADIDIVKGLAIFSVVVGHIVPGITSKILFLFHMPLFFIVSGFLHKKNGNESDYFIAKTISLLLPYFIYLFLIFGLKPLAHISIPLLHDRSSATLMKSAKFICFLVWGGRELTGVVGVFWFVTCLFLTQQLFNFALNRLDSRKKIFILATVLYLFAVVDQYGFKYVSFPWEINIVLCSFIFYTVGHIFGNYIFDFSSIRIDLAAILVSISGILLFFYDHSVSFNMKYTHYGWFIISPIVAISITKCISTLSHKIAKVKLLGEFLSFSGKASLTIMFTHQYFHYKFYEYSKEYPWILTFTIFFGCLILHYFISLSKICRLLFLGSRHDLGKIKQKISWRKNPAAI